jgi:predicted GNAT family acetyltransferase
MPDDAAISPIRHDRAGRRFVVIRDGHEAWLDYEQSGTIMTITHTTVPAAIGGRGIAGDLVRNALDFARAQGLRVHPACPYTDAWMRRHPGYDDLRT